MPFFNVKILVFFFIIIIIDNFLYPPPKVMNNFFTTNLMLCVDDFDLWVRFLLVSLIYEFVFDFCVLRF